MYLLLIKILPNCKVQLRPYLFLESFFDVWMLCSFLSESYYTKRTEQLYTQGPEAEYLEAKAPTSHATLGKVLAFSKLYILVSKREGMSAVYFIGMWWRLKENRDAKYTT